MERSELEQGFLTVWASDRTRPMPRHNYRFHATRKWELDFAWPEAMVAVELDGLYSRKGKGVGRHLRPKGFQDDHDKQNAAVMDGWAVLRYTSNDLKKRPVQVVEEVACLVTQRFVKSHIGASDER